MNIPTTTVCAILVLGQIGCGQAKEVGPQPETPKKVASSSPLNTETTACGRSLRLAHELFTTIEISDQRTATLWAEVGKCFVDTGDFDSALSILKSLNDKPQDKMVGLANSILAASLALGFAENGRMSEAAKVANEISPTFSDQRCIAFSGIAGAREAVGDAENATKFWNLAIQAASAEDTLAKQIQNEVIIVRSLVDHGRFKEAMKLPLLDGTKVDRSGWGPLAVGMAKSKDRELAREKIGIAEQIIRLQMKGLNQDLLQVIERVAPDGNSSVCEAALSMMNDPAHVGLGRCLMVSELIERGKREEARRLLATTFSELDAAKASQDATGRFLVAAVGPMTRLEGKFVGRQVCGNLEARFAPELAAEGYCLFAYWRFPEEKSDAEDSLDKAEQILIKVNDPLKKSLLFRRVYGTRSLLFGEENGLNAVEKVTDRIEKCFSLLGIAEGLIISKVCEK